LNFKIIAWDKAGFISVFINGKEYEYFIDAVFIPKILNISKFRPGKALNLLKQKGKIITTKTGDRPGRGEGK